MKPSADAPDTRAANAWAAVLIVAILLGGYFAYVFVFVWGPLMGNACLHDMPSDRRGFHVERSLFPPSAECVYHD